MMSEKVTLLIDRETHHVLGAVSMENSDHELELDRAVGPAGLPLRVADGVGVAPFLEVPREELATAPGEGDPLLLEPTAYQVQDGVAVRPTLRLRELMIDPLAGIQFVLALPKPPPPPGTTTTTTGTGTGGVVPPTTPAAGSGPPQPPSNIVHYPFGEGPDVWFITYVTGSPFGPPDPDTIPHPAPPFSLNVKAIVKRLGTNATTVMHQKKITRIPPATTTGSAAPTTPPVFSLGGSFRSNETYNVLLLVDDAVAYFARLTVQ
jgi:hypothetical protein